MSRIGKSPIVIPEGVKVEINKNNIKVIGKKGVLERDIHSDISIKSDGKMIVVNRPLDSNIHHSLHGLTRSLINNIVIGV